MTGQEFEYNIMSSFYYERSENDADHRMKNPEIKMFRDIKNKQISVCKIQDYSQKYYCNIKCLYEIKKSKLDNIEIVCIKRKKDSTEFFNKVKDEFEILFDNIFNKDVIITDDYLSCIVYFNDDNYFNNN